MRGRDDKIIYRLIRPHYVGAVDELNFMVMQ